MRNRAGAVLCTLAFLFPLPAAKAGNDLYGPKGVAAEAVRQGKLGSCYFHAVIAAMAQRRADAIRKMIQANSDGSYTVTFGDGKKETAYPEDLRYTHDSGYDLSDGQWVAVLFRAYAQRVLARCPIPDDRQQRSLPVAEATRRANGNFRRPAGFGIRPRHPGAGRPGGQYQSCQTGGRP